jgi:hypothetical protein
LACSMVRPTLARAVHARCCPKRRYGFSRRSAGLAAQAPARPHVLPLPRVVRGSHDQHTRACDTGLWQPLLLQILNPSVCSHLAATPHTNAFTTFLVPIQQPHVELAVTPFIAACRRSRRACPVQGSPCRARATPVDPSSPVSSLLFLILHLLFLRYATVALSRSCSACLATRHVSMPLACLCKLRHDPPLAVASAVAMAEPPANHPARVPALACFPSPCAPSRMAAAAPASLDPASHFILLCALVNKGRNGRAVLHGLVLVASFSIGEETEKARTVSCVEARMNRVDPACMPTPMVCARRNCMWSTGAHVHASYAPMPPGIIHRSACSTKLKTTPTPDPTHLDSLCLVSPRSTMWPRVGQ